MDLSGINKFDDLEEFILGLRDAAKGFKGTLNKAFDETKLSGHINLQLTLIDYIDPDNNTNKKIIHSFKLEEVDDPNNKNYLPFKAKDLGTITYKLYERGKTIIDSDKISFYNFDNNKALKGMYLAQPAALIKIVANMMSEIKPFESERIPGMNTTYRVSIKNLSIIENLAFLKVLPNQQVIRYFLKEIIPYIRGTYFSTCPDSKKLKNNGLEFYFSSI